MVRVSYEQKPYRRVLMHVWGAEVIPSPSDKTNAGRSLQQDKNNLPGSLGMAISEAVEDAATDEGAKYSLGSVLNHVLLHLTIVGLEAKKQLQAIGDYPDVVIGCVGGGSPKLSPLCLLLFPSSICCAFLFDFESAYFLCGRLRRQKERADPPIDVLDVVVVDK